MTATDVTPPRGDELANPRRAEISATADGRIVAWDLGAERVFGWSKPEVLGLTMSELFVPPELRPAHDAGVAALAAGGEPHIIDRTVVLPALHRSGKELSVELVISRRGRGSGQVFSAVLTDVTEAHSATERLQEAEESFRLMFEQAPIGMTLASPEGRYLRANPSMNAIVGYPEDELLAKTFRDITHPDDLSGDEAAIRDLISGQRATYVTEKRYLRADRSYVWVQISVALVRDSAGKPRYFVSQVQDIDERKRFEQRLQDANAKLATANRAKDTFLASVSHELRTPLNAILGFTGILLMGLPGPLNDDQEGQLRTVEASGRHLLSLINDLLDLARIESGEVPMRPEPIDCTGLLDEVASSLGPLAVERSLTVEIEADHATMVTADRRALTQILINLTGNAIKFSERGEVRLTVDQTRLGRTLLRVVDSGVGIAAKDQAKLFEAFEQLATERYRPREGIGLGLYISRQLAHMMNAEITLESEPGKGSVFTVDLPTTSALQE